jgi:hypothetical protein
VKLGELDYGPGYQILDGENRWTILKELGHTEVKVDNWGPISDQQAEILLATLNPLRGRDDPRKRATLLDALRRRFDDDPHKVARYVPETAAEVERVAAVRAEPARVIESSDESAGDAFDTFYCLLDDQMRKVVDGAIRRRREEGNLPGRPMSPETGKNLAADYDRGRALADICAQWIIGGGSGI